MINNPKYLKGQIKFDQGYIQEEIILHKNEIAVKELPLNIFPSGCIYFKKQCNLFYDENESIFYLFKNIENNKYVLVHYNCITSFRNKIYKQKELLMFNLDENNYYSSKTNKYIKIIHPYHISDLKSDKKVVMYGFNIAKRTNRIFILPKFNCSNSLIHKMHRNKNCSFDELFDVGELDKYLSDFYRENVYTKIIKIYSNF